LTWAEAFGLGELQLTPAVFWHLTPREFRVMREGFFRREDRAWEKLATLGLWVIAPYTKQKFTIPQLLGRHKLTTLPTPPAGSAADDAALEAEKAAVLARALAWALKE